MKITINQTGEISFQVRNNATQEEAYLAPIHTTRTLVLVSDELGLTHEETGKVAAVVSSKRPAVTAAQLGIGFSITPQ